MEATVPNAVRARAFRVSPWLAAGGWALVVLAAHVVGQRLVDEDSYVLISAPPLVGLFDVRLTLRDLLPLAVAGVAVPVAPLVAQRLAWRALLPAAWLGGLAWMLALAATRGSAGVVGPIDTRYEYLSAVPRIGSLHAFLTTYVDRLATYPTHVRGHPPGFTLLLATLDRIGLGGATVAALLVIAVGAAAAPAALVACRSLTGEAAARAAAPFVVFAPAAVWMATSADAFFAGLGAAGTALFVLAAARRDARGDLLALAAGLTLGAGLLCSYGLAPLGVVVLGVAVVRQRLRPLLAGAVGVGAMLALAAAAGFWWPAGLRATHAQYLAGVASRRPYLPFLLISFAAFAVATGPAPWVGLARRLVPHHGRPTPPVVTRTPPSALVLPVAALAAVGLSALSGLSKGETERIWLPFTPWVLLAAGGLGRGWLASALGLGLVVEICVASPW